MKFIFISIFTFILGHVLFKYVRRERERERGRGEGEREKERWGGKWRERE